MLAIAPEEELTFMAFVFTPSRKGALAASHCPIKSGSEKAHAMIWQGVREQAIYLPNSTLIGDKAFPDPIFEAMLKEQQTTLYAPRKKPKGKELSGTEKYYNRMVSKLRQPIESFFKWLIDKTDNQRAGKVRSTDALMIHCWGKLTVAFYLLVFYS